ncbi:response regulator [Pedobacter endophyticus]|uniref:Response regulator transcription factor n=1 Tax=Pedobacter endophyticus TaxID=2789740 RepID=A0A7U3SQ19_9SPHI|nr:response regulator [Pedobacter endophyticus]QPH37841.1 response regulator transcription factor [Pedobacter endophyticus]
MFKRVLIVEDHPSISMSVKLTLSDMGVTNVEYTYYCDDALMLIKKSLNDDQQFDLLVTDLYFQEDHRPQKISDGIALTVAIKEAQPNIKVLVFSAEDKSAIIDSLFKRTGINAYVLKARNDVQELKQALEAIAAGKSYVSTGVRQSLRQKHTHEFTELDITIISLLATDISQKEIPDYLKQNGIKQWSLSSVEKRLKEMREALGFSKNGQLIAYCKDLGII